MRQEGEDSLLRWLRRQIVRQPGELGQNELLGDDAAKIVANAELAITLDTQIEGVHFFPGRAPELLAERALAVNLSDLAAMGAAPRYAFLSLTAPPGYDRRAFLRSFLRSCSRYGVRLAGGDLSSAEKVQVVVTLIGERQGRFLERRGAAPGDVIYLGGEVGLSGLGLALLEAGAQLEGRRLRLPDFLENRFQAAARRALWQHLLPQPQLDLGKKLAQNYQQGGALDISDGLAKDLHRLCHESRVGARVELAALPMPEIYRQLAARLDKSWQELALAAGEDYVLLFTLKAQEKPPEGAIAIGRVTRGRQILLSENGETRPLAARGFDHLR